MRIPQERTPPGCAWGVAAGWMAWSLLLRNVELLDYVVVGLLAAFGIFLAVYRKIFPDAILITDELPAPGATFRATVETPLKSEPSSTRVKLAIARTRGRYRTAVWQSEQATHPMRGDRGIVFPIEIAVPAGIESQLNAWTVWRLSVGAGLYRASFKLATPRA